MKQNNVPKAGKVLFCPSFDIPYSLRSYGKVELGDRKVNFSVFRKIVIVSFRKEK